MPQGKMKVKAKLPTGAKGKKAISKPKDIQKKNRPSQPKKDLLRDAVTKAINDSNEMVYKQKVTLQGQKLHVVPTDDIKKGAPIKKDGTKMDKSRLPKKK